MKILIADDSKLIRQIITKSFEKEGYTVFEAKDGQEAVKIALEQIPDVILLDYMMPELNGLEVIRVLNDQEELKNTPIFILSAHRDEKIFLDAMELNIKGYITKPFDINEVIKKIKSTFEK